ncbi:PREDICTED: uncharacterized protein LOC104807150 isoform X3 [Tarenaya hassleriana]|uniref:uncharacterized protein LOC104807150 isoform X3 n=1 Tax=Tarenaya hassleriana TaxID=28532 RepID=UPI0008FD09EC|nr:PREDICTED: uncharacterized protein LOC104807150 isoform X3 [Tarenaya hassleriana]
MLFAWNIRGLNSPNKRFLTRKWILEKQPLVGALLETHIQEANFERISAALPLGWKHVCFFGDHNTARIWIVWEPTTLVTIYCHTKQAVTCGIENRGSGITLTATFVYASTLMSERRILWEHLTLIGRYPLVAQSPWIVLGDFNQTLVPTDRSDFPVCLTSQQGMRELTECVQLAEISDVPSRGLTFTWCNNHTTAPLSIKLDRAMANAPWRATYPNAYAEFLPPGHSDHTPCLVHFPDSLPQVRRPYKFFHHLTLLPEFLQVVRTNWLADGIEGTAQYQLCRSLKQLKIPLRSLNKTAFSQLSLRVQEAETRLADAQTTLLSFPTPRNLAEEKEQRRQFMLLALAEEKFYKQRSRIKWLRLGDRNTAYFHKVTSTRNSQNQIHFLEDHQGNRLTSQTDIKDFAVSFYSQLLGISDLTVQKPTVSWLRNLIRFHDDERVIGVIDSIPSEEEIRGVVFGLPNNKAPGPDGFPKEFYTETWSIVGGAVTKAVREFFVTSTLLGQLNATSITLVPKKEGAKKLSDFRPISCCNTIYKVIATILTKRLRSVAQRLVSANQNAFLKGRLMVENVLLASEIIREYNRNSAHKSAMIKIDIRKAFDSLEWGTIIQLLKAMSLPPRFTRWIEVCISTPKFSISVNGDLAGYFKGRKGLRQGDPLSPYLFIMAMEILSRMLDRSIMEGKIQPHYRCKSPLISHLSFADDIIIFSKGDVQSLMEVKRVLHDFSNLSGLQINPEKSELFLAGCSIDEQIAISTAVGIGMGHLPVRYLGVPLSPTRLSKTDYLPLLQKVKSKLTNWQTKFLSSMGKIQLITTVIYGLVNSWSMTFLLPKYLLKEIDSLCAAFLWQHSTNSTPSHRIAWDAICKPRTEGGLGLRRLDEFNKVFRLKLVWLLFSKAGSLWVAWVKSNIFKDKSYWGLKAHQNVSWNLRKLLQMRNQAREFIGVKLGNGRDTSFWYDSWLDIGPLIVFIGETGPGLLRLPKSATVADAVRNGNWSLPPARSNRIQELHLKLLELNPPTNDAGPDLPTWRHMGGTRKTFFSSRQTWEQLRSPGTAFEGCGLAWFRQATPRHAFLTWQVLQERLPTTDRLETFSRSIWLHFGRLMEDPPPTHIRYFLDWTNQSTNRDEATIKKLLTQVITYTIWMERNSRIHRDRHLTIHQVRLKVDRTMRNKLISLHNPGATENKLLQQWYRITSCRNMYWDLVWSEEGSGGTTGTDEVISGTSFEVVAENEEQVEISFSRKWDTSLQGKIVPINIDKRYIMLRDSSGFYSYAIYEHLAEWPAFNLPQTRIVFRLRKDKFRYMAVADNRQRKMPLPEDRLPRRGRALAYPEAVLLVHPVEEEFKGEVDDKYQYSCENKDLRVHGWISQNPPLGCWQIIPSNEFRSGGLSKQNLTSHVGPISLSMFLSAHYAGEDMVMKIKAGEAWKKVFGPVFTYLNCLPDGVTDSISSLWRDAKNQMLIEVESWPYDFPASEDFPASDQRGSISGRILVCDKFVNDGNLPANGAFIGLTPPGEPGSWQLESKGYQFWTEADEDGYFMINNIREGEYNLNAYVPGFIGDFQYEQEISITAGCDIDVGNIVHRPPRDGPTLWEIGVPDRSAAEFYVPDPNPNYINKLYIDHPDEFRQYGLWERYEETYPQEDLVYTVGLSDYKKDWFFAHVTRKRGEDAYERTTWKIKFVMDSVDKNNSYKLRIALATANVAELQVRLNDMNQDPPMYTTGVIGHDNAIARHGIHGIYRLYSVDVPSDLLIEGDTNTLFLTQPINIGPFNGLMYDYLRFEGPSIDPAF